MTDAPAYLPLPEKHGEPARVGRRPAPFDKPAVDKPVRRQTQPPQGERSILCFPPVLSRREFRKTACCQTRLPCGLASGHRFVPAFPIIRSASRTNLRGQKQGVQKRAYTARRNRRLRAEQRKRQKKIREEADCSSRVIPYHSVTAASFLARVSILAGPQYGFYIFFMPCPCLARVSTKARTRSVSSENEGSSRRPPKAASPVRIS